MSKTPSVSIRQLFQLQLIVTVALTLFILTMTIIRMYTLFQPVITPPEANIQQLQLQNALTIVDSSLSGNN